MMKVLFVSDNPIYGYGGGSVENRKHYDAIKQYCEKIGAELKVISRDDVLDNQLGIRVEKNRTRDILVRLLGHSSFLFFTWKINQRAIDKYNPDILYLGRSRFGFIAKAIKKSNPNCKVITNIDNVEIDYVDSYFALKKGVKNRLYKLLEKSAVRRDETDAIKYSDCLIYLTKRNVTRVSELYKHFEINPIIIPICLENETKLYKKTNKKTIVFIGSLDYAANILAANQLIEIWKRYYVNNDKVELIIAGRNPTKNLAFEMSQLNNAKLIPNFKSVSDVIPEKSLMMAPIEKGAGMKVKVAETLSMGLMIVASDEALVGYEDAIQKDKLGGINRASSKNEYIACIDKYLKCSNEDLEDISKQNKRIFYEYYTYQTSRKKVESLLNELLER